MSKNNLFIDIFRISPDGKYLEIDMTCHSNYTYESFEIQEGKIEKSSLTAKVSTELDISRIDEQGPAHLSTEYVKQICVNPEGSWEN